MQPLRELRINTKKRPFTMGFMALWVFLAIIGPVNSEVRWGALFFGAVAIYISWYLFWLATGTVRLLLTEEGLKVTKSIFGIPFSINRYNLIEITQVRSIDNQPAKTYWSIFRLGGYTPEWARVYDINPNTIHFNYQGSPIKIGEGLEAFKAGQFVHEIKALQRQVKNEIEEENIICTRSQRED